MHTLSASSSLRVRASWDTEQRLPYNPNAPRKLKKDTKTLTHTPSPKTSQTVTLTASTTGTEQYSADLLKRNSPICKQGNITKNDEFYLGYDRWLPSPPKVEKPRSIYNAASLAYLGDCIYELYARRHFLFPPLSIEEYNDRVMAVVRCEAQDALLQKLINSNFLSKEERDILRWGKNIVSAKTRTKKRAGAAVYTRASSLETLVGYLYLTNTSRLEEVMLKLGFAIDSSEHLNLEEAK
ncbi:Ribonuclease III family protein [Quillaja saponaria]|uniref:Ribonuclease III family protein n=1 Tax=Quillaja saponaria TaxID=32244 RepID=A0AAD7LRV3_QUISA|nr:Ribonuclease III family protein [Quillaja saponaria]